MRHLRLLGLTLLALLSLGALASSAFATEAGWLPLAKAKGVEIKETKQTSAAAILETATGKIECANTKSKATTIGNKAGEETHYILGAGTLEFTGCKLIKGASKLACNSKGDKTEVILVEVDIHLVNLEPKEGELEAGLMIRPKTTLILECAAGTVKIEVKGWALGLVLASLTAEVTEGELHFFSGGEICDKTDELCKKLTKEEPFEANLAGKFEPANEIVLAKVILSEMVLVDD